MLSASDRCSLPCWWGLIPGQSTYEESKDFFIERGIPVAESFGADVLLAGGAESEETVEYLLGIHLTARGGIVVSMTVLSEPYSKQTMSATFTKDWTAYAWSEIMARYGKPSRVTLFTKLPSERGAPFVYSLSLFYAEKGFLNDPQRCPPCRGLRRRERATKGKITHSVTCAECGAEATVPFIPKYDKPVYCSTCFDRFRSEPQPVL